jgi:hypothetical protein
MIVALLLIAFFVNVPVVSVGPVDLWHEAPVLLVLAGLVDVFLVGFVVASLRRRLRELVQD